MERLRNWSRLLYMELIDEFKGGNRDLEIFFTTKNKAKYKLVFKHVWDLRWSIENGYIDRFFEFRKNLPENIIENSIYIVENSEYIEYFIKQISGTLPVNKLVDYLLYDEIDTVMEILANEDPILVKLI